MVQWAWDISTWVTATDLKPLPSNRWCIIRSQSILLALAFLVAYINVEHRYCWRHRLQFWIIKAVWVGVRGTTNTTQSICTFSAMQSYFPIPDEKVFNNIFNTFNLFKSVFIKYIYPFQPHKVGIKIPHTFFVFTQQTNHIDKMSMCILTNNPKNAR
mgnify:FL=1